VDHGHRYSIAQRVQCLTLLVEGLSGPEIEKRIGVKPSTQSYIKKKALQRGFRPQEDPRILDHHVMDGASTGRPKKIPQAVEQQLIQNVKTDRAGREK
jgi:hypothetical protein